MDYHAEHERYGQYNCISSLPGGAGRVGCHETQQVQHERRSRGKHETSGVAGLVFPHDLLQLQGDHEDRRHKAGGAAVVEDEVPASARVVQHWVARTSMVAVVLPQPSWRVQTGLVGGACRQDSHEHQVFVAGIYFSVHGLLDASDSLSASVY